MIQDSFYWKQALLKQVAILRQKLEQRVWRDSSFGRMEQAIMTGSYIVRKLVEAKKISDKLYQQPLAMRSFPATGQLVTLLNKHRIVELYEVKGGRSVTKPLSYVINQIIHSFIFEPIFEGPSKVFGIAFNSDRSKQSEIYLLALEEIIGAFAKCGNYYAGSMTVLRVNDGSGLEIILDDDC
jgi:hypothetical protein